MNGNIAFILLIIGVILVSGCASKPQVNDTVSPSNATTTQPASNEISMIAATIKSPLSEEGVAALGKLATIGTEESVQVLLDKVVILDEFKGKNIDESGLIAIFAQIENSEATAILVNKLKAKTTNDEFLVPGIARALGNIGNKEATDTLIEFAQKAYDQQADYATVQQEYYFAIERSKDLSSLMVAAKNNKLFWEIRARALKAIGGIAKTDVLSDLEKIRDDPTTYIEVQRAADQAMTRISRGY